MTTIKLASRTTRVLAFCIGTTLAACSPAATDASPTLPADPSPSPSFVGDSAMLVSGVPGHEQLELGHWEGSLQVLEGPNGAPDTLELSFSANSSDDSYSTGVHLVKALDADGDMRVGGRYALAGDDTAGPRNQLNAVYGGQRYIARTGEVELRYAEGQLSGRVTAQLIPEQRPDATPIAIEATFEGGTVLGCHALTSSLPPSSEGGELQLDGRELEGPSWRSVPMTHPVCRRYL